MQVSHLVALVGGKSHNPVSAGGHPTVDAESRRNIACQVAVVTVKAFHYGFRLCDEGLHLHIGGRHQRTGYLAEINSLVALIDMIGADLTVKYRQHSLRQLTQTALELQGELQAKGQFFPTPQGAPEDSTTGRLRQIVFLRHGVLQNLR